jgi:CBS domain-containing protein
MKTVGELMTRDLVTLKETQNLALANELLLDNKFGCLPVVGDDGNLLGILTEADLVRYAQQLIGDLDRLSEAAEFEE